MYKTEKNNIIKIITIGYYFTWYLISAYLSRRRFFSWQRVFVHYLYASSIVDQQRKSCTVGNFYIWSVKRHLKAALAAAAVNKNSCRAAPTYNWDSCIRSCSGNYWGLKHLLLSTATSVGYSASAVIDSSAAVGDSCIRSCSQRHFRGL